MPDLDDASVPLYYATTGAGSSFRLGERRSPILTVAGELDYALVRTHRAWANGVPNARVVVVPTSGHATAADRLKEFNRRGRELLAEPGR